MKIEDVVSYLRHLGLGEYEARVYHALCVRGPLKAGEVSKESGVPQSKIYWTLEELISKRMAEVMEGRPKEYRASDPEISLKLLIAKHEDKLKTHKSMYREVVKSLRREKKDDVETGIWTIRGRHFIEFFERAASMIDKSDKYVFGVTRDFSKSSALSQAVRKARQRGVKIRVIGMEKVGEDNAMNAKWYTNQGIELRTMQTKMHPRIVLVDGKEVLLRLDHRHDKKEGFTFNSFWSQDPSLVKVFDTYMKNAWQVAQRQTA
jgi:sugar-specific transcriptional regulator TrmB